jgi:oligopeptide transport system substrate-binding protein
MFRLAVNTLLLRKLIPIALATMLALVACTSCGSGAATPIPTDLAGKFTHRNDDKGFSVTVPSEWLQRDAVGGPLLLLASPDQQVQVSVFREFGPAEVSINDRMGGLIAQFQQAIPGLLVEDEHEVRLPGGGTGRQAVLSYAAQGTAIKSRIQVVARAGETFQIISNAPEGAFNRLADAIDEVLLSFTLYAPEPFGIPTDRAFFTSGMDPVTLDPAMSRETRSHQFVAQIYSGLTKFDSSLRVQPDLAAGWSISDDGMVYTFTLREGITFHDGTRITAEDVRYSLERATDPALLSPTALTYLGDIVGVQEKLDGDASTISGIEVLDSRRIRITIDGPKVYFLAKLTYPTGAITDHRNVEPGGVEWWRKPNGSGPFKLRTWEDGNVLILERHDGYLPGPAKLEFAVFHIMAGIPLNLYEAGTVDVADIGGSDIDRARDPDNKFSDQLQILPQLMVSYIGFNTQRPPFDDPLIRRAFAMAVDRERLVHVVFEGKIQQAKGILPPGLPGYNPGLQPLAYDPEEALRLIEQSSFGSVDALPEIVFTTPGLGGLPSDLAFILDDWASELGVVVSVRQLEPATYFYRLSEELDNLYDSSWVADYPDPENFLDILFHSGNLTNNPGGYENVDVDRLLEQARVEQDWPTRQGLYWQAEQLLVGDAAVIPLVHGVQYLLVKPYVSGLQVSPFGYIVLNEIEIGER